MGLCLFHVSLAQAHHVSLGPNFSFRIQDRKQFCSASYKDYLYYIHLQVVNLYS